MSRPDIKQFLGPGSVAVIGASADRNRIGGMVFDNLVSGHFAGPVYAINPARRAVQGHDAYPSISAVPGPVDLAVIAVPAAAVQDALDQCAAKGVKSVVVLSAGFGEVAGATGTAAQDRLISRARDQGMRILGPNCAGFVNFKRNLVASFHPAFRRKAPVSGRVGLVSQSGAFGGLAHYESCERGLGLSCIVTTGNEADIHLHEVIAYMAADPDIAVILAYVESIRDGRAFAAALARAHAAGKPLVMVKVGDSEAGVRAAASHTGALAGAAGVTRGLLAQYGVNRAESLEELFSLGYAFARCPLPTSPAVLIVTASGGIGVLLADDCARRGLCVAELPAAAQAALKKIAPNAGVANPVDLTGNVLNDPALMSRAVEVILGSRQFGALVIQTGVTAFLPGFGERIAALAQTVRARAPTIPILFTGFYDDEVRERIEAAGAACFVEPTHTTRAIAALYRTGQSLSQPRRPFTETADLPAIPANPSEAEALQLLAAAGIATVCHGQARGAEAAAQLAKEIGFPVALKIHSARIAHKSDIGAVRLGLRTAAEVLEAAREMTSAVERRGFAQPDSSSFLVARMMQGLGEAIIGTQRDPVFGTVVMFGLGGIHAESIKDVVFRIAPIDPVEALRMIREIRSYAILEPHRGRPGADLDALASAISRLSVMAQRLPAEVLSVEVNPLLLLPAGVVALDALITMRRANGSAAGQRSVISPVNGRGSQDANT